MSFIANNGLQIMIQFSNGLVHDLTSLVDFYFIQAMNTRPVGVFRIADYGSKGIRINNGDFANLIFTKTSDNVQKEKASIITILIDKITADQTDGPNTLYSINFSVTTKEQLKKKTIAYKGNSIDALQSIIDDYKGNYSTFSNLSSKCADKMTWRIVSDNMWEQLNTVVSKSFIPNDFLYWCWDDVNNTFKISSFNSELQYDEYQLAITDNDNIAPSDTVMTFLQKPNITLYKYNGDKRYNDLGKNRNLLFPNVAFTGVREGKMQECLVKGTCFEDTLSAMGDNSRSKILAASGLDDNKVAYGELKVIRNWPNNVHNMYSVAPVYRDYKISTFAKKMNIQLHNVMGPVIGSKFGVLAMGLGYKTSGRIEYDNQYSDSYIVASKIISYDSNTTDKFGRTVNGSGPINSTITLMSSNLDTTDDYIQDILKKLGTK